MKSPVPLERAVACGLLLAAVFLCGCGAQQGATPLNATSKPAPPPANLTPEQKREYDEALQKSPSSPPAR